MQHGRDLDESAHKMTRLGLGAGFGVRLGADQVRGASY